MLTHEKPEMMAVNVRFALNVIAQALDTDEPVFDDEQKQMWLGLDYSTGQGLLLLVKEADRAVGALVQALGNPEQQVDRVPVAQLVRF